MVQGLAEGKELPTQLLSWLSTILSRAWFCWGNYAVSQMAIRLKAFIVQRAQASIQITYEVADAVDVLLRPASFDIAGRSPSLSLELGNTAFSGTV